MLFFIFNILKSILKAFEQKLFIPEKLIHNITRFQSQMVHHFPINIGNYNVYMVDNLINLVFISKNAFNYTFTQTPSKLVLHLNVFDDFLRQKLFFPFQFNEIVIVAVHITLEIVSDFAVKLYIFVL